MAQAAAVGLLYPGLRPLRDEPSFPCLGLADIFLERLEARITETTVMSAMMAMYVATAVYP